MYDHAEAYGLKFAFPAGDTTIGPALREAGEFARPEVDLIASYLESGGDFLDIGCNIGSICLPIAQRLPSCRVRAVEGARLLADLCHHSAAANKLTNVEVIQAVVAAAPGVMDFSDPTPVTSGNLGIFAVDNLLSRRARVRAVTVDQLVTPATRFIKIDVEGYESQVLAGAVRTLAELKPIILAEANPGTPQNVAVAQTLLDAGYRCFWFFAPHITKAAGKPGLDVFAGDTNFVALPPGVENAWGLTALGDPAEARPRGVRSFPYLTRYGY